MKVEKILEKLVSFNTVSDTQNKEIMSWLEKYFEELGFVTKKIEGKGKTNLWVGLGKNRKTGLMFIGHTDTVSVSNGWKSDPFKLVQRKGQLYGLGTSDMKGGIAAFLKAAEKVKVEKLKKNLEAIFTYDEEINFNGIREVVKRKKIESEVFLIGEPTENIPVVAHKGPLSFRATFFGKAVHGSRPDEGKNAIYLAMQMIEELKRYAEKVKKKKNDFFDPAWSTLNVGKICGGDAINKVPDECVLEFEWRVISEAQRKEILANTLAIVKKNGKDAKVEITLSMPAVENTKVFVTVIESILKIKSKAENYATEASFLGKENVIILGPGPMNAHIKNEFVSLKSLLSTVNDYEKLIDCYCS